MLIKQKRKVSQHSSLHNWVLQDRLECNFRFFWCWKDFFFKYSIRENQVKIQQILSNFIQQYFLKRNYDNNIRLTGSQKINNQDYDADQFSRFAGYVMQEDLLLSNLTVKEYITFAADIRLTLPKQEKSQRVFNILKQLKLEVCQNTLIGDQQSKGISGNKNTFIFNQLIFLKIIRW
ncbi:hypothetical protein ABPG72_005260 [Tetrahymena utriculariae]